MELVIDSVDMGSVIGVVERKGMIEYWLQTIWFLE
jgi:hypothetical protein